MSHKLFSICLFFLFYSFPVYAQQGYTIDHVYYPGYIAPGISLSIFTKSSLRPACDFLQKGDNESAEPIFAKEVQDDSEDLSAYVGYFQAARGHRDQLYLDYFHQAEYSPRPENAFRFGVLAFYMSGERFEAHKMSESDALGKQARQYLQRAYDLSHSPITGFMLVASMPYTGGGDDISVYESLLRRLGGEAPYYAYVEAKRTQWHAPQPPIPHIALDKIVIIRWIVACLLSSNSWLQYKPHTIDGKTVYEADEADYTPEQRAAMAYLGEWRDRLVLAASRKQK